MSSNLGMKIWPRNQVLRPAGFCVAFVYAEKGVCQNLLHYVVAMFVETPPSASFTSLTFAQITCNLASSQKKT